MKKRVDYSALLHCVLMQENYLNQYRFTFTLNETIDINALQNAVNKLIPRFPMIFTHISKDLFWYYLETLESLKVEEDPGVFCSMNHKNVYSQAIRIFYKENTISLEAFHALTDGSGILTLLYELINLYLQIKNKQTLNYSNNYALEEIEDSFETIKDYPKVKINKKDHLFKFDLKKKDNFMIKQYEIPISSIKACSKRYPCTINELLLALFYKSISTMSEDKSICLSSPIDLRKHFPSKTLRNFSLSANIVFDHLYKSKSYLEVIKRIKEEMRIQNTKKYLGYEMSRIVMVYNLPFIKYCPLLIKKQFIKLGYKFMGEKSCMTITNLGYKNFPECVDKIEVMLSPRLSTPLNCAIISLKDTLVMNVSHDGSTPLLFDALDYELKQLNLVYTKRDA